MPPQLPDPPSRFNFEIADLHRYQAEKITSLFERYMKPDRMFFRGVGLI